MKGEGGGWEYFPSETSLPIIFLISIHKYILSPTNSMIDNIPSLLNIKYFSDTFKINAADNHMKLNA